MDLFHPTYRRYFAPVIRIFKKDDLVQVTLFPSLSILFFGKFRFGQFITTPNPPVGHSKWRFGEGRSVPSTFGLWIEDWHLWPKGSLVSCPWSKMRFGSLGAGGLKFYGYTRKVWKIQRPQMVVKSKGNGTPYCFTKKLGWWNMIPFGQIFLFVFPYLGSGENGLLRVASKWWFEDVLPIENVDVLACHVSELRGCTLR